MLATGPSTVPVTGLPPVLTSLKTVADVFGPTAKDNSTATDAQPTTSTPVSDETSPTLLERSSTASTDAQLTPSMLATDRKSTTNPQHITTTDQNKAATPVPTHISVSTYHSSRNISEDPTGDAFGPAAPSNATESVPTTAIPTTSSTLPVVRQSSTTVGSETDDRNSTADNATAFIAISSRAVPAEPLVGTVDVRMAATLLVLCAVRFFLAPWLPSVLADDIERGWSDGLHMDDDGFKNLVARIPVFLGRALTGHSFMRIVDAMGVFSARRACLMS